MRSGSPAREHGVGRADSCHAELETPLQAPGVMGSRRQAPRSPTRELALRARRASRVLAPAPRPPSHPQPQPAVRARSPSQVTVRPLKLSVRAPQPELEGRATQGKRAGRPGWAGLRGARRGRGAAGPPGSARASQRPSPPLPCAPRSLQDPAPRVGGAGSGSCADPGTVWPLHAPVPSPPRT